MHLTTSPPHHLTTSPGLDIVQPFVQQPKSHVTVTGASAPRAAARNIWARGYVGARTCVWRGVARGGVLACSVDRGGVYSW